jgi:hypothetical protein
MRRHQEESCVGESREDGLVREALQGKVEAFSELVRRYRPQILTLAARSTLVGTITPAFTRPVYLPLTAS